MQKAEIDKIAKKIARKVAKDMDQYLMDIFENDFDYYDNELSDSIGDKLTDAELAEISDDDIFDQLLSAVDKLLVVSRPTVKVRIK